MTKYMSDATLWALIEAAEKAGDDARAEKYLSVLCDREETPQDYSWWIKKNATRQGEGDYFGHNSWTAHQKDHLRSWH